MQAIGLPKDILTKINTMFYKFIWQRKYSNKKAFEKVKRKVMESDFQNGGLNMVNMLELQEVFNLQWIARLHNAENSTWACIPRWHLFRHAKMECVCEYKCCGKELQHTERLTNVFWKEALVSFLDSKGRVHLHSITTDQICAQPLFNNSLVKYKGKVLHFLKWQEAGCKKIVDLINSEQNRLKTAEELKNDFNLVRASYVFEYNAIVNAIPKRWLELIRDERIPSQVKNSPHCKEIHIFCQKPKAIRQHLNKFKENIKASAVGFWQRKLGYEVTDKVWLTPRKCTSEVRLRELHWKIVYNLYPTNILLYKMKVVENSNCSICTDILDTMEHFFFHCPGVRRFWQYVEIRISLIVGMKIIFSQNDVLFGWLESKVAGKYLELINHVLLVGKMCISKVKKTKSGSSIVMIFEQEIILRKIRLES
jgi:hypothetical protein